METVEVRPAQLRWARERGALNLAALAKRFPRLEAWEEGQARPSLAQLERFAKATHTPIGYFFLPEPPEEKLPIPDFRRMSREVQHRPSPDLLDTVYLCQQRQDWYRDYAHSTGQAPRPFIGSARLENSVPEVAAAMRARLGFDLEERRALPTWTDALRRFIGQADSIGVLVMVSGVVGSNNRRALDPREFRGFAIADEVAPLVFVNGADTKAAQMFTLAHELAHLWLGQSALTDASLLEEPDRDVEIWCDKVAAELLVPLDRFAEDYDSVAAIADELPRLARLYKVSSLVVLRRMRDAGGIGRAVFFAAYEEELSRLGALAKASGGDFYLSLGARVGKSFARAVAASALEGRSSFTEAFRMLGLRKMSTFDELCRSLGLVP
jgi:Zn-dependent peptidase ImmA (M78 family)